MHRLLQLLAAVASATLYGWAFPPAPWRALAWIALVPLFVALRTGSTRWALVVVWVWTVALGCVVNDWFPRTVSHYFGQPYAVGLLLFLGVCTFTCGLQTMVFAVAYRTIAARVSIATPFLVAAAWIGADLLRVLTFGGDPWGLLGYSQVGLLPLVQIADATGVHGITFVVVSASAAVAQLWSGRRDRRARATGLRGVAAVAAGVATVMAYGALRLATPIPAAGSPVTVGVVQAHLTLGSQWRRDFYGRNLDTYLRLSHDTLVAARPRLLVWPENAMTFFVADEPTYRAAIASLLAPFGAELIAGGPHAATPGEGPFRNSAFLLGPDGEIRGRYDKRILLPFAEYFPARQLDILRRHFGRVREFVPGDGPVVLETVAGRAGIVICNEGFFGAPAAASVQAGATLLVNLANDSWLGEPKYSEPAFDMVRVRAVEQRRWVVRASTAGPSAIVDPYGRVVARTALFQSTTLAGAIEPVDVVTPFARAGDLFAWVCAVVAGATLLARRGVRLATDPGMESAVRADR